MIEHFLLQVAVEAICHRGIAWTLKGRAEEVGVLKFL
jgi:hypothetical protein